MKTFVLLITLTTLTFCNAQEKDYSELKYIYTDLVEAFKSKDDQVLQDFCYQLGPDEATLDYMRQNNLCYRGIPCKMDEKGMSASLIGDRFFPQLLRVRDRLMREGLLDNLKHIDATNYKWEVMLIVNQHQLGYDKPVYQDDHSMSVEQYDLALKKADSIGKTFEELVLNGRSGKVHVIKGTETSMRLQSGNTIIEYLIGEMMLVNNKWCLFTSPNVDIRIIKE